MAKRIINVGKKRFRAKPYGTLYASDVFVRLAYIAGGPVGETMLALISGGFDRAAQSESYSLDEMITSALGRLDKTGASALMSELLSDVEYNRDDGWHELDPDSDFDGPEELVEFFDLFKAVMELNFGPLFARLWSLLAKTPGEDGGEATDGPSDRPDGERPRAPRKKKLAPLSTGAAPSGSKLSAPAP